MWPGSYRVAETVTASGGGSVVTFVSAGTCAEVSKIAARTGSNRGSCTVASACASGARTATGATHATGLSPGKRKRSTVDPAASLIGPTTLVAPGIGTESTLVSKNRTLSSRQI